MYVVEFLLDQGQLIIRFEHGRAGSRQFLTEVAVEIIAAEMESNGKYGDCCQREQFAAQSLGILASQFDGQHGGQRSIGAVVHTARMAMVGAGAEPSPVAPL